MLAATTCRDARRKDQARRPGNSPLPRYAFDGEYVRRLTEGDAATEEHFIRYFGDLLTLKLRGRLRSPSSVEDAKQETFVRVFSTLRTKGGLASAECLGSFVNSVCNNVLFEAYRAEGRQIAVQPDAPDPADPGPGIDAFLSKEEDRARVRRVIAELPEKDQDLLRWLFFEERDKDDVCRTLGIDRQYLRVLLHRAKQRFKVEFGEIESTVPL